MLNERFPGAQVFILRHASLELLGHVWVKPDICHHIIFALRTGRRRSRLSQSD
jgi:hypothetical protein